METLKRFRWPIVGIGIAIAVVAFFAFRPDKLFVDDAVDESLAEAFTTTTAQAAPPETTTSTTAATETTRPPGETTTTTQPQTTTTTAPSAPVQVTTGAFYGIDHSADGTASVYEQDGTYVLRFEDDTNIQNGPDLYVWVLPSDDYEGGTPPDYIDLGKIKGNVGGQNYALPADFDPDLHRSVMVWCVRFSVPFAAAALAQGPYPKPAKSGLELIHGWRRPRGVGDLELRSFAMVKQDRWAESDVLAKFNKREYRVLEVSVGMTLTHTGSRFTGTVAQFTQGGEVVLTDRWGEQQAFPAHDGAFMHNGSRVSMRDPVAPPRAEPLFTASGSIDAGESRARIARASRIWVEGLHDAELIEKIWGDDLREAAVVVEPLHGADDLVNAVTGYAPSSTRRLGVLLDHLVEGSKESRIAQGIRNPDVLICGHPYVDIWAAIKPATIGIAAWPDVEHGRPWKEGVLESLGLDVASGSFWAQVLDSVTSYRDVETPLVNAVEQLIDFVTVED